MELHTPNYFYQFQCLAQACPHTCCAWWEVPIDDYTARLYRDLPGSLGERVRSALIRDEEGKPCFRLIDGKCSFLNPNGLCALQQQGGESRLPAVCREHPRFSYDYGPIRERGLCGSCPEAARIILAQDFTFLVEMLPEPGLEGPPFLNSLVSIRNTALRLLKTEGVPLPSRLRTLLLMSAEVQAVLDQTETDPFPNLYRFFGADFPQIPQDILEEIPIPLPNLPRITDGTLLEATPEKLAAKRLDSLRQCLEQLLNLEILTDRWWEMLEHALSNLPLYPATIPEVTGERAASYFIYRHWLRSAEDWDVLSWMELAVLGVVVSSALAPLDEDGFAGSFRRFCQEVEHDQDNLDALQAFFVEDFPLIYALSLTYF